MVGAVGLLSVTVGAVVGFLADRFPAHVVALETGAGILLIGGFANELRAASHSSPPAPSGGGGMIGGSGPLAPSALSSFNYSQLHFHTRTARSHIPQRLLPPQHPLHTSSSLRTAA